MAYSGRIGKITVEFDSTVERDIFYEAKPSEISPLLRPRYVYANLVN